MPILFVQLSDRRYLALDVSGQASGYYHADGRVHEGYLTTRAEMITPKPVSWAEATAAASRYAIEHDKLVTPDVWQNMLAQRET
jgi:hypothetical protein